MTEKNTYLLNPETVEEMTRLTRQGSLITQAIGLFPEGIDLSHLPSIEPDELRAPRLLDIGCGPGDWALDVAARYPHVQITGIDISQLMVSYATTEAANRELFHVDFQVMDALEPFPFADESFDVINIRVAVGFVPRERWPALFAECKRLIRGGGITHFDRRRGRSDDLSESSDGAGALGSWPGLLGWDQFGSWYPCHAAPIFC